MKKVIMFVVLFFGMFAGQLMSQWTTYTFRLYDNAGAPVTGEEANIKFTKYPHVYADDQLSGITVDEDGSTGIYMATGFTTLQYVRIWLSGVVRSKPDSVLTGNLFVYISSTLANYVSLAGTQTISGTKTFGNGNISGDWQQSLGTFTMYGPKINTGATIYSAYGSVNSDHMVWRGFTDSNYVPKSWMYDAGSGKLRLQSGYTLYGRTNTTSPIPLNTAHFEWADDKLNVKSSVLNADSIKHKIVAIGKDTTWSNLGEDVTKWRFLWLEKPFWSNPYIIPDWKWYYGSYDESGVQVAYDSMMAINDAGQSYNNTNTSISGSTWAFCDTLALPIKGKYHLTYSAQVVFPSGTGSDAYDTIWVDLGTGTGDDKQLPGSQGFVTHFYDNTATTGGSKIISWSTVYSTTTDNRTLFLRAKNTTGAVGTMYVSGVTVTWSLMH